MAKDKLQAIRDGDKVVLSTAAKAAGIDPKNSDGRQVLTDEFVGRDNSTVLAIAETPW